MNRYTKVRELVKDPSLTIKDIAQQTGYDKGHVSRLRKASQQFECPRCGHCCQPKNDTPLRDFFAAKAMTQLFEVWEDFEDWGFEDIAERSYAMADAMLEARER